MTEAVDYVGHVSSEVQRVQAERDTANTNFEATFIFGGQIAGHPHEMYMIYPQGNHIHESGAHPFLQIGETKYGKPILDRVIRHDTTLEQAARCALVSNTLEAGRHLEFPEDDPYYRALGDAWNEGLRQTLNNLPPFEWEGEPLPLQVVATTTNTSRQMQG
jgi:putative proteasome-type protease